MNRLNENIISNTARNLNQTKITRNQNIELEFTLFYQFKNNLIYILHVKCKGRGLYKEYTLYRQNIREKT